MPTADLKCCSKINKQDSHIHIPARKSKIMSREKMNKVSAIAIATVHVGSERMWL